MINSMIKSIMAVFGIIAIITNASSPDDAIIIATNEPKLNKLWVNSDTTAKPPMHPGTSPSRAARNTCFTGDFFSLLNDSPCERILMYSMSNIITITSPVIRMLFLRASNIIFICCFCRCQAVLLRRQMIQASPPLLQLRNERAWRVPPCFQKICL